MYIYKITNNINGNSYVGLKTTTPEKSAQYYGSGKLIQDAVFKYGKENFTKEILERDIEDFDFLLKRETYYINLYDTKRNGYNMTDGGLGMHGYSMTDEHKLNLAESLTNHKHSIETKKKISEAAKKRKGRPVSEATRKKLSDAAKKRWKQMKK
jgi:group I intron endonuclease